MIRSRDLLIFVACLFVLGTGILYTLVSDSSGGALKGVSVQFNTSESPLASFSAVPQKNGTDRQANIVRLRDLLKKTETVIVPAPSTEPADTDNGEEDVPVVAEVKSVSLQKCVAFDNSRLRIETWPQSGISVQEKNGNRVVIVNMASTQEVGTSTMPAQNTQKVLLTLPVQPTLGGTPSCVPSDVIGVTLSGVLILNSDVSLYRGYGPEYLIGYARDGFPIYGYYEGDVDSCGGYQSSSSYRYTVSPDRDFILGCFVAPISEFTP